MLELKNVTKSYNNVSILKDLSYKFDDGNIYALVGVNGIGKTTLLNSICIPSYADKGNIYIHGCEINSLESRYKLFYSSDDNNSFLDLLGKEYIEFIVSIYKNQRVSTMETIDHLIKEFKMNEYMDKQIKDYSYGTKRKLFLIGSFISGAVNKIYDEPFNGLDPEASLKLKQSFKEYRENSLIIYSAHNLDLISNFSDKVIFFTKDRNLITVKNNGNLEELQSLFLKYCIR